jgi:filamentous hemagglutinin
VAAQRQDVGQLEQEVRVRQAFQQQVVRQAEQFTDEAYRTMFLREHPIYEVRKGPNGERELVRVTDPTKLQAAADDRVHIAANGIFNDAEAAGKYADEHSTAVGGPQYVMHFPEASNTVAELLVAGYQRFLEGDLLGNTRSTEQIVGVIGQYGATGLNLDGHSRGAMTVDNALGSYGNLPGSAGSIPNTTVRMFGPAANVQNADNRLGNLQGRSNMTPEQQQQSGITYQNHMADPVGRIIGLNPATGGTTPEGSSTLREALRVMGGDATVHNCYGTPTGDRARQCHDNWNDSPSRTAQPLPVQRWPKKAIEPATAGAKATDKTEELNKDSKEPK